MAENLVIKTDSVSDTRTALRSGSPVIGWVDITSPNLVDLIEDLRSEGELIGVRWSFVSGFTDDICILRGLRTLAEAGVALKPDGSVASEEILRLAPGLRTI